MAYSGGSLRHGEMRRRLEEAFDDFNDLFGIADADAARLIASHEIDILIDLKGHTKGARLGVLALRPAPVLMHYLGYPGTLGGKLADYLIGDPVVTPLEHAVHYSEKLVVLPDCYQPNDRGRRIAPGRPRAEYGLPQDALVLACFNQTYKLNRPMFELWCAVLAAVPDAVLWVLESRPGALENLRREMRGRAVAPERLIGAQRLAVEEHLARIRCADLCIDTFPYGSHTTASDALWCGVPIATLAGKSFASRVAASLLRNVGLGELVADSFDGYGRLLLALAADRGKLSELRRRLAQALDRAPLFDSLRHTRSLERAFERVWSRACEGAPAEHLVLAQEPARR